METLNLRVSAIVRDIDEFVLQSYDFSPFSTFREDRVSIFMKVEIFRDFVLKRNCHDAKSVIWRVKFILISFVIITQEG